MTTQTNGTREAVQRKAKMDFLLSLTRTQLYAYALFKEIPFKHVEFEIELEKKRRAFEDEQKKFLP
jgi:hypothetical protein